MKTETLSQPAIRRMEVPSYSMDDVSPNSSAVMGVTLIGDWHDVKAVLRTAVLLARNLRTPLFFGLPGNDILPVELGEAPNSTLVSELLDSGKMQGRGHRRATPSFAMEVNVIAASFVSAGSITMRVRTADSVPGHRKFEQARNRAKHIQLGTRHVPRRPSSWVARS